jgi:hypothetical protein
MDDVSVATGAGVDEEAWVVPGAGFDALLCMFMLLSVF